MALSPWARVSAGGLPPGLPQVRWWVRFVSSVANCWLVSPVVRWLGNGLSRCGFENVCSDLFSIFLPLVGPLSSWWVRGGSLLLNKPQGITMQNILDLQTIETTEDTNQTEQPWSLISLFICK